MRRRGSYGTATHPYGTRSTMERRGIRRRAGYGSTHRLCDTGGPYIHLVSSSSTLIGGKQQRREPQLQPEQHKRSGHSGRAQRCDEADTRAGPAGGSPEHSGRARPSRCAPDRSHAGDGSRGSRMEVGTIRALHAVLLQLARPGMNDVEAYRSTGASRSNFTKWRRRVQHIQSTGGGSAVYEHLINACLPPTPIFYAMPSTQACAHSPRG